MGKAMWEKIQPAILILGISTAFISCTGNGNDSITGSSTGISTSTGMPIELVPVSAGWFEMGQRDGENGNSNELPRHFVYLDSYLIGKYEVTNSEYADVLNWALGQGYLENHDRGAYTGGAVYFGTRLLLDVSSDFCQIAYSDVAFTVGERDSRSMANHPVVEVSWCGAVAWCNWRSLMEGLTPCYDLTTWQLTVPYTNGCRLPTEAEWERAASWDVSATEVTLPDLTTGKHWIYGFGSDSTGLNRANYCNYDGSYHYANPLGLTSGPFTSPAGWFDGTNGTVDSPSLAGCYDMGGNVWEWCHDGYGSYLEDQEINPTGYDVHYIRCIRGGSWNYYTSDTRGANRLGLDRDYVKYSIGFRFSRSD